MLGSGDEAVYVRAGLAYIAGEPPAAVNPEHPPLAKYVIGACYALGLPGLCSAVAVVSVGVLAFLTLRNLGFGRGALLASLAAVDPIVLSLAFNQILDTYMLPLAMASLYIATARVSEPARSAAFGAVAGLAIAAKWPAALLVAPALLWLRFTGGRVGAALAVMSASYLVTFSVDATVLGPKAILEHQVYMAGFMSGTHAPGAQSGAGAAAYLLRLDAVGAGQSRHIEARLDLGNPALTAAPALAALAAGSPRRGLRLLAAAQYSSLLYTLAGPVWWYYSLPAATGYMTIAAYADEKGWAPRAAVALALGVLVAWSAQLGPASP